MGQGGFQAAAPAGHCSDDVWLWRVTSVARLWWSIAATSHLSYITASTAPPIQASPVLSSRESWLQTSSMFPLHSHDHHTHHEFLLLVEEKENSFQEQSLLDEVKTFKDKGFIYSDAVSY